jgi:hypothetical protein
VPSVAIAEMELLPTDTLDRILEMRAFADCWPYRNSPAKQRPKGASMDLMMEISLEVGAADARRAMEAAEDDGE